MTWSVSVGLLALVVVAYAGVRHFDFVDFDDYVYVRDNPHVRDGLTWPGLVWAFSATYAANWHPLTWLSHMADVALFGMSPGGHHVTSLLLHAVNTLLVWVAFRRLTGRPWRSALVAAIFAVHPLHVESVAWIAERKDLLSTMFAMLVLWSYAGYVRMGGRVRYAGAVLFSALSLMAKPMFVTIPFLMLLLDVWPLQRMPGWSHGDRPAVSWSRLLVEKVPFAVLALGSSAITIVAQHGAGAVVSLGAIPLGARVCNAFVTYVIYLRQTIWPARLAAFYPYPLTLPAGEAIGAVVFCAAVTVALALSARTRPYLLVGWLWFVGTLVPVIGLVQVGAQAHADRYMYAPLLGILVAAVWGASELAARWAVPRRVAVALSVAVVTACAAATDVQSAYWQDGIALWQHAVSVTPPNSHARSNLGVSLAAAGRQTDAIAEYREAIAIDPGLPQAHYNLGLALVATHDTGGAIAEFREAVRLRPDYASAHDSLGNALMDAHQVDAAVAEYREALRIRPDDAKVHNNLGTAFAEAGRPADAAREFIAAVGLEPQRAEWQYAAGIACALQGDEARAIEYLREAVRLDPRHERARRALADLTGAGGRGGRGGGS